MGFNVNIHALIKRAKNLRVLGTAAFGCFVLLTLLSIFPIVNHQESAEAAYIPSSSTLAIVSSKDTASVDITPISSNGTFVISDSENMAEFTVTTNNLTGYSLNMLGTDTSGQLVNVSTSDALDTISSTTTENDFRTGAAATYTNKWGYRLNINNTTTTDFMSAPTSNTAKTIYTTSTPNTPGTPDNYKLSLGARADYTKPSGTYTNTFVLTAVGNPISYQINYDDTTTDTTVTNIPADEGANDIEASGFTLSSTVPTRTGYTFAGWCDGTVTHTNLGDSTCSGTTYAAGASYNFSSVSGSSINTANLHAMWNVNTYNVKVNFAGSGVSNVTFTASGQTTRTVSTSGGTTSLTYGIPYTMTMNLTNNSYVFSSWALNNASYGTLSSTTTNPATFTVNENSNSAIITATGTKLYMQNVTSSQCTTTYRTVYDNRDEQAYVMQRLADGNCWMMTNLNLNTTNVNLTSANTNLATTVAKATFNSWKKSSGTGTRTAAELIPVSGTDAVSGTPYGTLYNYCAASGGDSRACVSDITSQLSPSYDICPKGWRLPTGGDSSGEFYTLVNNSAYDTIDKLGAPYTSGGAALASAGYFHASVPDPRELGDVGNYWSSTWVGTTYMAILRLAWSRDHVYLDWPGDRSSGLSIRCVLK